MDMILEELRSLISRHVRQDMGTSIPGVMIAQHDTSSFETSMSGTVMALVAQGSKRIALGERVYEYGPGQYLVSSLDLPVTGQFLDASQTIQPLASASYWIRPTSLNCCCKLVRIRLVAVRARRHRAWW